MKYVLNVNSINNGTAIFYFTDNQSDPCHPSPCGSNTICNNGECSCLPQYHGDPYIGCRPECTVSADCARNLICNTKKCINPCPDICGSGAECEVINHVPMCSCPVGFTGNSFVSCNKVQGKILFERLKFIKIIYNEIL